MGKIIDGSNKEIGVYKNPLSLKNFGKSVRAVSDNNNANLFVAQFDTDFTHGDFSRVLGQDVLDNQKFITWIRISTTDTFSTSFSYEHQLSPQEEEKLRQALFAKHPYKFFIMQ